MTWLRKHMRTIFLITIIGFLAGIFIGFGGYFFGGRGFVDAVAEVNGVKILYRQYTLLFNRIIENMRDKNKDITEQVLESVKRDVLQELIQEEVLYQESKKFGIVVTDFEVASEIHNFAPFQRDGRFDQGVYFQILIRQLHMTPKEFEESRKRQIASTKMRNMIIQAVKVTEPELRLEYARRHNNSLKNLEKDRKKFTEDILNEKRTAYIGDWYKSINASLKVKVFEEMLKRG